MNKSSVTWAPWLPHLDLRDVDWIKELLYLTLATAEACVLYPWYLLFNRLAANEAHAMPPVAMIVLMWIPYLLAGLLNRSALTADRKQAAVAALMLLMALIVVRISVYGDHHLLDWTWFITLADRLFGLLDAFPPDLPVIGAVFVAWWRGIILSRHDYDMHQVGFHFRLGIIILVGYFVVHLSGFEENALISVIGYFFFGLLTVALARVLEVGGIHSSTLGSRQWIAILIGASAGSMTLAMLVAALFSRQVLGMLLTRFKGAWNLVTGLVWYVVAALIYLFFPLVEWIIDVARQLQRQGGVQDEQLFGSPLTGQLETLEYQNLRPVLGYCNTILMIVLFVGGVVLIARLIRRMLAQEETGQTVERESLGSLNDLANDLRNGLKQGLDNLRAWIDRLGDRRKRSAASIRRIYASMVDLASEAGYPRRPAATPYEYSPTLCRAFPGGEEAVRAITEAYVRVHYGQLPDTPEEMQQIVRHWERLQQIAGVNEQPSRVRS